jgi:uncharacterized protein YpmB
MGAPEFLTLIIGIGLFLLVFLLIRSIMLWYWKIDKQLYNQEVQISLLEKQNELLEQQTLLLQSLKGQSNSSYTSSTGSNQA